MASLLDLADARLRGLLDSRKVERPSMVGLLGSSQPQGTLASSIQGFTPTPMQAMSNQAVMDYARNVASTARQNMAQQMSDLDRALVMDQGGINVGDRQALARLMDQIPGLMGATAYHGTPHTIRGKFDISKVGTGEGAQAYGHGMYFAESPDVAKVYADKLGYDYQYAGKTPKEGSPTDYALRWLKNLGWDKEAAKAQWKNDGFGAKVIQAIDKIDLEKVKTPGNLYKVDIPDEYIPNMLDWDKPLTEQTPQVRKALESLGIKTDKQKLNEFDDALLAALTGDANAPLPKEPMNSLGSAIYQTVLRGTPEGKSAKLREAGITGIRYLDQGSRGKGGTSNFVVFDPTDVKILEKNNKKIEGLLD